MILHDFTFGYSTEILFTLDYPFISQNNNKIFLIYNNIYFLQVIFAVDSKY